MSVDDGLELFSVSELSDDARFAFRVEESFELAVQAVGTDTGPEVFGGDFRSGVGFIDDEKIVRQKNAFGVGREPSGVEEGEEQAVVDDYDLGFTHLGAGTLVVASIRAAILSIAG